MESTDDALRIPGFNLLDPIVTIVLDGEAVAAARPRFARVGNFVKTYNPAHVTKYRERLTAKAAEVMAELKPFDGTLAMYLLCVMPIPASMPKGLRASCEQVAIPHVKKPDASNILKNIEDALKGIVYTDDARLATVQVRKIYGTKPRIEVIIGELRVPPIPKRSIREGNQPRLFEIAALRRP